MLILPEWITDARRGFKLERRGIIRRKGCMAKGSFLAEDIDKAKPILMCPGSWRGSQPCGLILRKSDHKFTDEECGAVRAEMIMNFRPYNMTV